jgi:hypothetical protein
MPRFKKKPGEGGPFTVTWATWSEWSGPSRTPQKGPDAPLVYGEAGEGLVFMPKPEADELAALRKALQSSTTWGELRNSVSEERWQGIREAIERVVEDIPDEYREEGGIYALDLDNPGDAAFDYDTIPGHADGDWPEWPAQQMLEWMPSEIVLHLGEVADSMFNGEYLVLPLKNESAIVEALEAAGWACKRNDDLVQAASGY